MDLIRNILVIVDPTATEHPAVSKAAALAKRFNARIELFACGTRTSLVARKRLHMQNETGEAFETSLSPLLDRLAQPLRNAGLDVSTGTTNDVVDALHAAVLKRIKEADADWVVKDTHHHSIAKRTFLRNTDWQLIRDCQAPLLLVKNTNWGASPRVMAAIDPNHVNDKPATLDRRIIDHASLLARKLEGELHVVHAYLPWFVTAGAVGGMLPAVQVISPEAMASEEARLRAQINAELADSKVEADKVHLALGGPVEAVLDTAASIPADIAVMGAISRSSIGRIFIGSTAEEVLERLPCDALVVKTPDFSESLPF